MKRWNTPTSCSHYASYYSTSCFCCSVWSKTKSENRKPKHITIVIKCSKMMQAVPLHCYNAEGWLLLSMTTYDSVRCLDYAQAAASLILGHFLTHRFLFISSNLIVDYVASFIHSVLELCFQVSKWHYCLPTIVATKCQLALSASRHPYSLATFTRSSAQPWSQLPNDYEAILSFIPGLCMVYGLGESVFWPVVSAQERLADLADYKVKVLGCCLIRKLSHLNLQ